MPDDRELISGVHQGMAKVQRSAVYIDALNLYNGALKGTSHRWLDIRALAQEIVGPDELTSVVYVTGELNPDDSPDPDSPKRQAIYTRAIAARGGVSITRNRFVVGTNPRVVSRNDSWHERTYPPLPAHLATELDAIDAALKEERRIRVRLPEEKMTDVGLAVAMVNDFHLGHCDRTVLVANDSDYKPALDVLASLGQRPLVVSPQQTVNKHLKSGAWDSRRLDRAVLLRCELPDSFRAMGTTFTRPVEWR